MENNLTDQGIILVDKPKGITSFDVIRILRKKLDIRKIGHAGTLDPLASGLMILGINEGTKKLTELIGLSKKYRAEVLLGVKTDTSDLEGKVLDEKEVPEFEKEKIIEILNSLIGKNLLKAPVYSAIKKAGKPLYKRVRSGEKVTPPLREMEVFSVEFLDYKYKTIIFEIEVSSGTYIRSIAEEIGDRLGNIASLKNLRRLEIGEYSVEDAIKV